MNMDFSDRNQSLTTKSSFATKPVLQERYYIMVDKPKIFSI